jgi:hypothetical protein
MVGVIMQRGPAVVFDRAPVVPRVCLADEELAQHGAQRRRELGPGE